MSVDFIDLSRQYRCLAENLDDAFARVFAHGQFIQGPEVQELESRMRTYVGAQHAITCANGTDALQIALRALDVGPGDLVFVPSLTFAATIEAVLLTGAKPFFVDVESNNGNIDPECLKDSIAFASIHLRYRLSAVICVDLFGALADYEALEAICRENGLLMIEDGAQAFGASDASGRKACSFADIGTTSFHPTKSFACFGDGGAMFTNDNRLAECMRSIANHGVNADGSEHILLGTNSRLDTLQAAVLLEKFKLLDREIAERRRIGEKYTRALESHVKVPRDYKNYVRLFSYYPILSDNPQELQTFLGNRGITTKRYYQPPNHKHAAFRDLPYLKRGLPVTEKIANSLLCLPIHAYLEAPEQDEVIQAVLDFCQKSR
ncbi:MAG: DegT/DnrJ/EryC1/StrS family aminotransferase [Pseudomonadota bacterium]